MRYFIWLVLVFVTKLLAGQGSSGDCYDKNFVEISVRMHDNQAYSMVSMQREGGRIKARYFAAPDGLGNNAYNRYLNWARDKKIILVSAGTYVDGTETPVGLTIDNGITVNNTLTDKMDGLVIVYANGGIAVSNLKNGDLKLRGSGVDPNRLYDIISSAWDLQAFTSWAASEEATVFQTHLLVYKNELQVSSYNSSQKIATRRFLAVGKDINGKLLHVIVDYPFECTLYQGTKRVLDFLNSVLDMDVIFMINLDTGSQNVFNLYSNDCQLNEAIKGKYALNVAINILAYYFE